ncbi:MAG: hypothetical protein PHW27_09910 [Melioribacteraceae bacterium]|nr:hypothetical protein [Melioribacteraceae bacterium]MDD3558878.1 hypothetical protein [Melioribacteraceae bacterium]
MGHKRLNVLPKSKKWRDIVKAVEACASGKIPVEEVAKNTLANVRKLYRDLEKDPSVKASLSFLVQLSLAFKTQNPGKYLVESGILSSEKISLISFIEGANAYKKESLHSKEYQSLARSAVIDAINNWYYSNIDHGVNLFSETVRPENIFAKAAGGGGFSDLSRLFFAKFTERYLKYFLEREAAPRIKNVDVINKFSKAVELYTHEVSKHAFETSKITQSYAAGWFNKHASAKEPSGKDVDKLIRNTFGKMQKELLFEEMK